LVPLRGARHIGDVDHEMIEGMDFDRHGLSLCSRFTIAFTALAVSIFVCYNAARSSIQQQRTGL
jgi:hypothetical protein